MPAMPEGESTRQATTSVTTRGHDPQHRQSGRHRVRRGRAGRRMVRHRRSRLLRQPHRSGSRLHGLTAPVTAALVMAVREMAALAPTAAPVTAGRPRVTAGPATAASPAIQDPTARAPLSVPLRASEAVPPGSAAAAGVVAAALAAAAAAAGGGLSGSGDRRRVQQVRRFRRQLRDRQGAGTRRPWGRCSTPTAQAPYQPAQTGHSSRRPRGYRHCSEHATYTSTQPKGSRRLSRPRPLHQSSPSAPAPSSRRQHDPDGTGDPSAGPTEAEPPPPLAEDPDLDRGLYDPD